MPNPLSARSLCGVLAAALSLAGCAATPDAASLSAVRQKANPADRAQRSITNFTPALRCMDDKLFALGVRDVTLMMEEMRDATLRVPVATRDMMVSAMSDMTRRSRAVRLSVFGSDQQNLASLLQQAQRSGTALAVPRYNLRGTISQFDEAVERRNQSVQLGLVQQLFGVKLANDTRFSVMGFDAGLVDTASFTLIPGVTSKNQTVLATRDAQAGDGEARLSNPGLSLVFSFAASRSDGLAQAARNMVELAAVELVGKLLRMPYWQCLGVPDSDAEVQRELDDWFLSMSELELRNLVQERLRELKYYNGRVDGAEGPAFAQALGRYRQALGLTSGGPLDQEFFRRFVTQAVPRLPVVPADSPAAGPAPGTPGPGAAGAAPLRLARLATGPDAFGFVLSSDRPGYAYCYAQDPATGRISRVYPNRFATDPHVARHLPVVVQSQAQLTLPASASYGCLFADTELYGDLPAALRWGDFEPIRLPSLEAVRDAFAATAAASGGQVSLQRLPAP